MKMIDEARERQKEFEKAGMVDTPQFAQSIVFVWLFSASLLTIGTYRLIQFLGSDDTGGVVVTSLMVLAGLLCAYFAITGTLSWMRRKR